MCDCKVAFYMCRHSDLGISSRHGLVQVPMLELTGSFTSQMSSVQPKAAVEFDQAINYVNKIKVRIPVRSQRLLSAAASNVKSRPVPALPICSISGSSPCQSPAGLHLPSQAW